MPSYQHLTREESYTIQVMLSNGHSQATIARALKVSPSTVSREIHRDGMNRQTYRCKQARQDRSRKRPLPAHRKSPELWQKVDQFLVTQQWSPEQISGYLAKTTTDDRVSHEAIYWRIYQDKKKGGSLHEHLRQGHRKRRQRRNEKDNRGIIKNRVCIENRPAEVEEKLRIGDLEMDTVIGRPGGSVLVTMVDRVSKYTLVGLAASKRAEDVSAVIYEKLRPHIGLLKTLTYDNGKEFANHDLLDKMLGTSSYFAHPYHSWERGLNENTNGLIRQYLPKRMDFDQLSLEQVQRVEDLLNSRPRKTLDYSTPTAIFQERSRVALPS